jgi:riboflavin transporter FmnP
MIYHAHKSRKTALVGMIVGTLVMTVFGSLFNAVYLLPKFAEMYGMPLDAIVAMGTKVNASITSVSTLVLFAVVPFNLLKGVIDSGLTFLLYKRISPILHKEDAKRVAHKADAVPEPDKSKT